MSRKKCVKEHSCSQETDAESWAVAKEKSSVAYVYTQVYTSSGAFMPTIKVGVREFRERIATFLESDTPVAVTRRGETLGVYVPTRRKQPKAADLSELKAAADRLAEALADVDEEEFVANFKQLRRRGKAKQLK